MQDSTTHNLFPLEIILAFVVGAITTIPGALLGRIAEKLMASRAA